MAHSAALVVDDDASVSKSIARCLSGYPIKTDQADTFDTAVDMAQRRQYAVIAVDLNLAKPRDGFKLIDTLRETQPYAKFVLVSGNLDVDVTIDAINKHHVASVLRKPWTVEQVVSTFMAAVQDYQEDTKKRHAFLKVTDANQAWSDERRRLIAAVQQAGAQVTETLINTLAVRGHEGPAHCRRVAAYSLAMGKQLNMPGNELNVLQAGAMLHDLGKVAMPDSIFTKREGLTEQEWELIRRHPDIGARMLSGLPMLAGAQLIVQQHHERWDGTGYPRRLKGQDICLGARIFAVADTFDALCSKRSYHPTVGLPAALAEITEKSGTHFDPEVVQAFLRIPPEFLESILAKYTD